MFTRIILLVLIFLSMSISAESKNKYAGIYYGSYSRDSFNITITLNLKDDGYYKLDITFINTNTKRNFSDAFYLIPLHTEGKWFVK